MIIPKQFLKTIKRSGLGKNLFDEMRYDDDGNEIADFVLNQPAYRDAQILVAGENFGCGSSREHAPWALLDFGIRCVIAPSFADIFFNNCFKNGILPIVLPQEDVDKLMDDAEPWRERRGFGGSRKPDDHRADGGSITFRGRSVPQALPAQRSRRYRPDDGKGRLDRHVRGDRRRRRVPGSNPLPRLGNLTDANAAQCGGHSPPLWISLRAAGCAVRRIWAVLWQKSGAVRHDPEASTQFWTEWDTQRTDSKTTKLDEPASILR
jgi:hypothetical protein